MDPKLNQLLKWSIENSTTQGAGADSTKDSQQPSERGFDAETLSTIMGGPSDAELMKGFVTIITSSEATLENKVIAFDNFEQLIESLDNANLLAPLELWTPLFSLLSSPEKDLRFMAAWCIGTAVQNNKPSQDSVVHIGGVPTLVNVALEDADEKVRGKAIYALSSEVRNFQPGLDALVRALPEDVLGDKENTIDAGDMDWIDELIGRLRQRSKLKA